MAVKRPALTAIAELYVSLDLTIPELSRAVSFRRKSPRECESCGHPGHLHYHPEGWCMDSIEEKDGVMTECECEGLYAAGRKWRIL